MAWTEAARAAAAETRRRNAKSPMTKLQANTAKLKARGLLNSELRRMYQVEKRYVKKVGGLSYADASPIGRRNLATYIRAMRKHQISKNPFDLRAAAASTMKRNALRSGK